MAKILIIKLGYSETLDNEMGRTTSLGDVLRTTVILDHFKNDEITWLTDEKAYPLLENNPYIRRLVIFDLINVLQLKSERFDTLINFEKLPGICALADSISAWRRFGFRFDENLGEPQVYDRSEAAFSLCLDVNKKREHKEPWQKILIEMIGGAWHGQEYTLGYKPKSETIYDVGLNFNVGKKWPNKAWPKANWEKLAEILKQNNYSVSWQEGMDNLYKYMDWINKCRVIISSDSLGFHIALSLRKGAVVLFGPTNAYETFMYDRGVGIYPENFECAPCLRPTCDKEMSCIQTIIPEQVFMKFEDLFQKLYNNKNQDDLQKRSELSKESLFIDPRNYNQPVINFVKYNSDLQNKIKDSDLPKIKNPDLPPILLPESYTYIAVFLTFACPLKCSYCINRYEVFNYKKGLLNGEEWVKGLNRIISKEDLPLTIQGGEPTIHKDFYHIIQNIKPALTIDLLTNLECDIDEFMKKITPERLKRDAPYASIRVSYHPETMDLEKLIEKALTLLKAGYSVGIWSVLHPKYAEELLKVQKRCINLGIDFRFKELLGMYDGKMYGNYKYNGAVEGKFNKKALCKTTELNIGPTGDIYRCTSDLYEGRQSVGNILDPDFQIKDVFRPCNVYGHCNPCDVKIKTNRFQQYGHTSVEIKDIQD